jgi:hypothetical protein
VSHRATGLELAVLWLLLATVRPALGGPWDVGPDPGNALEGQPIESGFVIVDGQYLSAPYVVERRSADILINEHLVQEAAVPDWSPGPGPRPFDPRGGWPRWGHGPRPIDAGEIERRLRDNALLVVREGEPARFIGWPDSLSVMNILLSDATAQQKVESLAEAQVQPVPPADWARIVEAFEPTSELAERVRSLTREYQAAADREQAYSEGLKTRSLLESRWVIYTLTVMSMALAALAMGSLVIHPPDVRGRWRDVLDGRDNVVLVARNVALLVLLGLCDLACTLVARQAGGFVELNPFIREPMGDPLVLASLKIPSLLGACLILLLLRRYRGAQVASWWLCLVCTVLSFRWLTFNSLFLT